MNFQNRVEAVRDNLTKSEVKIVKFIENHPDKSLKLSINELASCAQSSSATVTRLVKKLGIDSFTAMKVMISKDLGGQKEDSNYQLDVRKNESFISISDKLQENYSNNIMATKELLKEEICQSVVNRLLKTKNLYVYGVGASSLASTNIYQKWSRIGCHVVKNQDFEVFLTNLCGAKSQDTLWLISNSGETKEVLKLANFAKQNNIFTISLTKFGQNSLVKNTKLNLTTCKPLEPDVRVGATNSIIGQFYVIDVIFYLYFSHSFEKSYKAITASKNAVKKFK